MRWKGLLTIATEREFIYITYKILYENETFMTVDKRISIIINHGDPVKI